ncbi:MAG: hypothetical protein VXZ36_10760 [Pseudomonadota bacterium]|jgi:hypothetical protein|nr:hypothetical protein [Pseudomonadota bacterium]
MLSIISDTDANTSIKAEAHSLYKLCVNPTTQVAIETKPVFGANITLHSSMFEFVSFIVRPHNIIGWVDHTGLSHFNVQYGLLHEPQDHPQPSAEHKPTSEFEATQLHQQKRQPVFLPSQFLRVDNGIVRTTLPTRIYLLGRELESIHKYGVFLFSPF